MTTSLSNFLSKINVDHSFFQDGRNKEIAEEVCKRHTLQSVLESLSDLKTKEKDKPATLTQAENIQYLNKVVDWITRRFTPRRFLPGLPPLPVVSHLFFIVLPSCFAPQYHFLHSRFTPNSFYVGRYHCYEY